MTKSKGIVTEGNEMEALVDRMGGTSAASPLDRLAGYTGKKYRRGQVMFLLVLFLCAAVLIFRYEEIGEWFSSHEEDVEVKPDDPDKESKWVNWGLPDIKVPSAVTGWFKGGTDDDDDGLGGDGRRSFPELLESLSESRKRIDELLRDDYGEYAFVFNRTATMDGNGIWSPTELSLMRLKRRMKRKVIESQLRGGGEHDEEPVAFTWVTGGHSAAAAHGDLINQSYTVAIQTGAQMAFDAVDVKLVAKSYGMGSASSPELSLCMDEIYGKDIDALNWDFGMTDGRDMGAYNLWVDQAGLHPTFPILFAHDTYRKGIHEECEKRGQAGFSLDTHAQPRWKLPDTANHPNPESLPRAVRYYRCGGQFEAGGLCGNHKFDTKWCGCRGKVSWHPGWKDHLFMGRFIALFLVENLVDAVREMHERDQSFLSTNNETSLSDSKPLSMTREYLNQLLAEEQSEQKLFLASSTATIEKGIDAESFKKVLRGNPICHSLRLPSQARFDGILDGTIATDTGLGGIHTGIDEHYTWATLPKPGPPSPNDTLKSAIADLRPPWMMAIDQAMRNTEDITTHTRPCNLTVVHDFRDGFVIRHEDDWMGDVYPSDAEVEAFSRGKYEREGFIIMCDALCMFGNCQPGGTRWSLKEAGLPGKNGNITIMIDGQPVTSASHLHQDCYFMVGDGGNIRWGAGTKNDRKGQYEIKFKIPKPGSAVISSLVVV